MTSEDETMSRRQRHSDAAQPFEEVDTMIAHTFQDAFSDQWVKIYLPNRTHDLVLLRQLIPWQSIIDGLVPFYNPQKGRHGCDLRILSAVSILARLRGLSDRQVIASIQENRYMQYFCNVPDPGLMTFMHPTSLCRFRKRVGSEGIGRMEDAVFSTLKQAGVIDDAMALIDSTVLESPIVYPTDVTLLYKAFHKMVLLANQAKIDLWWDQAQVKQLWRAYHLDHSKPLAYLCAFYLLFEPALETFAELLEGLPDGHLKERWNQLLETLLILDEQTALKLEGETHIPQRLVSLDDPDARPIQKGKRHPKTEFGTMLEFAFNRQGFMITTENFIGHPNDKTLYGSTLERFKQRMAGYPTGAITDRGYRSAKNLKLHAEELDYVFMGHSKDVNASQKQPCISARSATEGFIAVAKNLRGFARSLYRGLEGARVWTLLNQCAYNLKKVLQLYRDEALSEDMLTALRL
jgi:IS5 family transposase